MLENFFFTYANLPLREDPKSIMVIADELEPHIRDTNKFMRQNFQLFLNLISKLTKMDNPEKADLFIKKQINSYCNAIELWQSIYLCAFGAVYQYSTVDWYEKWPWCPAECVCMGTFGHSLATTMKRHSKEGTRLKCHECMHLNFRDLLLEIIKRGFKAILQSEQRRKLEMEHEAMVMIERDKECPDYKSTITNGCSSAHSLIEKDLEEIYGRRQIITDLSTYLKTSYDFVKVEIIFDERLTRKEGLLRFSAIKEVAIEPDGPPVSSADFYMLWQDYLVSVVGYSLFQYLIKHGDRHLKLCPYCHRFFHANDKRWTYCHKPPCKRLYDAERQWKLRATDPVKHGTTSGEKRSYRKKVSHEN